MNAEIRSIINQIGGNNLKSILGCKFVVSNEENAVSLVDIKSDKCDAIKISTNDEDSYNMKFYKYQGRKLKTIGTVDAVYGEQMVVYIDQYIN